MEKLPDTLRFSLSSYVGPGHYLDIFKAQGGVLRMHNPPPRTNGNQVGDTFKGYGPDPAKQAILQLAESHVHIAIWAESANPYLRANETILLLAKREMYSWASKTYLEYPSFGKEIFSGETTLMELRNIADGLPLKLATSSNVLCDYQSVRSSECIGITDPKTRKYVQYESARFQDLQYMSACNERIKAMRREIDQNKLSCDKLKAQRVELERKLARRKTLNATISRMVFKELVGLANNVTSKVYCLQYANEILGRISKLSTLRATYITPFIPPNLIKLIETSRSNFVIDDIVVKTTRFKKAVRLVIHMLKMKNNSNRFFDKIENHIRDYTEILSLKKGHNDKSGDSMIKWRLSRKQDIREDNDSHSLVSHELLTPMNSAEILITGLMDTRPFVPSRPIKLSKTEGYKLPGYSFLSVYRSKFGSETANLKNMSNIPCNQPARSVQAVGRIPIKSFFMNKKSTYEAKQQKLQMGHCELVIGTPKADFDLLRLEIGQPKTVFSTRLRGIEKVRKANIGSI